MRTGVPEKLRKIVADIDAHGQARLTRLTVLKKWFERTERLGAFAIWVATRAVSFKGKVPALAAELFAEARKLLRGMDHSSTGPNRQAAQKLHDRLRGFQNEYRNVRWGPLRSIRNWDLFVVEEALDILLWHSNSPTHGYTLAADYCQHYDSRYGNGLSGPSRARLAAMVRFMVAFEASEVRSK